MVVVSGGMAGAVVVSVDVSPMGGDGTASVVSGAVSVVVGGGVVSVVVGGAVSVGAVLVPSGAGSVVVVPPSLGGGEVVVPEDGGAGVVVPGWVDVVGDEGDDHPPPVVYP